MRAISDASALDNWRKSSHSENGQNGCIEVSDGYHAGVPVRDSKNPTGPALVLPTPTWVSFVGAVKRGDLPL